MSHYDHDTDERYVREEVRRFKQHLLTYLRRRGRACS